MLARDVIGAVSSRSKGKLNIFDIITSVTAGVYDLDGAAGRPVDVPVENTSGHQ